jgi:hypothetical protein
MLKAFPLNEALNIALSFTYCFNILCLNLTCAMSRNKNLKIDV